MYIATVCSYIYSGITVTGSYTIYCTMYIVLYMLCDQTVFIINVTYIRNYVL